MRAYRRSICLRETHPTITRAEHDRAIRTHWIAHGRRHGPFVLFKNHTLRQPTQPALRALPQCGMVPLHPH